MNLPHAWQFVVLALAAMRLQRLAGWDDLPPILRLRAWATGATEYYNTTENRDSAMVRYKRPALAHFLGCAFCLGFWISVAFYVAWILEPHDVMYVAVPLALSTAVGIGSKKLDD